MLTSLSMFMCYSLTQLRWVTAELVQTPQGEQYLIDKNTSTILELVVVTTIDGKEVRLCQ